MPKNKLLFILFIVLIAFLTSCSMVPTQFYGGNNFYYTPAELKSDTSMMQAITTGSEFLSGRKIFLDPGHGGEDRKNISPNGYVVEADANLRITMHLKEFLESAGAIVYLSRMADETVDLLKRPELLNETDAEIFISIHHNAAANSENYWSNYTSTYYHSRKGNYDYNDFSRDLAKYVQRDLSYAMRTSGGLGSFDGTYSDFGIYPGEGFAVLREAGVPAILVECSFFTNPVEEIRLAEDEFNKIQAWSIFKGLVKFYKTGYPVVELDQSVSSLNGTDLNLSLNIQSETEIDEKSIEIFWDKQKIEFDYDNFSKTLTATIQNVYEGEYELKVNLTDKNERHNYPFKQQIKIEFD